MINVRQFHFIGCSVVLILVKYKKTIILGRGFDELFLLVAGR